MTGPGAVTPGLQHHCQPPVIAPTWATARGLLVGVAGGKAKRARVVDDSSAPRLLQRRVDALTLAYQGELRPEVVRLLNDATCRAYDARTAVDVDLGGVKLALSSQSRDGWWVLDSDELHAVVQAKAMGDWRLEVKPRALLLGRRSTSDVVAACDLVAQAVLWIVMGSRVRRVDLAADFDGFELGEVDACAWLLPSPRTSVQDIARFSEFRRRGVRTGFVVGRSDVMLRCYDKTEELALPQNAGAKREEELARWTRAGWREGEQVCRVEFQLRGQVLEELKHRDGRRTMRDPGALLESLDAVWRYCSQDWVRLIVEGSATRRERCKVQRRWQAVQAVRFDATATPPLTREHRRGEPQQLRLALLALRTEAVRGCIDSQASDRTWDLDQQWANPDRARRYVERRMRCSSLADEIEQAQRAAPELLARRFRGDWKAAGRYLIELQRAELARGEALTERLAELAERAAIQAENRPTVWKCRAPREARASA